MSMNVCVYEDLHGRSDCTYGAILNKDVLLLLLQFNCSDYE